MDGKWMAAALAIVALAGCLEAPSPAGVSVAQAAPEPAAPFESLEAEEPAPESRPQTFLLVGDAAQLAHVRVAGPHAGMSDVVTMPLPRAGPRDAMLVATWQSRGPLDSIVDLRLVDDAGNMIAFGYGVSPLEIPIDGVAFGEATLVYAMPEPSDPGAFVASSIHVEMTVRYA